MENIEIWEGKHFLMCVKTHDRVSFAVQLLQTETHIPVRDKLLDDACNFPRCSAEVFEMIPN